MISVFDFGSNSIKFARFEAGPDGRPRRLDEARSMVAAGDDAFSAGRISEATASALEGALLELRQCVGQDDRIVAAATSAFREAGNGREIADRLAAALGAVVEILPGETEARLCALGALAHASFGGEVEAAVLDIGGGSAQVVIARPDDDWFISCLDLGAIRLRETHSPPPDNQPYTPAAIASLEAAIARELDKVPPPEAPPWCFGIGGGFATLGAMLFDDHNRSGVAATRDRIAALALELQRLPPAETAARWSLPLRRARIMAAGATVAWRALERLGVERVEISWGGLRDGLAARALGLR